MFPSTLFSDSQEVRSFNDDIQSLLRQGEADEALRQIKEAIDRLQARDHAIARLIFETERSSVEIQGWQALSDAITDAEHGGKRIITAVGIDMSWPGHVGLEPDANGWLEPYIETNLYTDSAYPFSTSDREELLRGYEGHGSEWQGCFEEIGNQVTTHGLGGVYGAVGMLEAARTPNHTLDALDHDLYHLGSAYVAVRLHLAVRDILLAEGLRKPLAVLVGSNEAYPFFDAPVLTVREYTELRGPDLVDADAAEAAPTASEPEEWTAPSGTALRQRIRAAEAAQGGRPETAAGQGVGGLFKRLLGRR